jgi:hypothetical protein
VRALSDNTQVTIVQAVRGAVVSDGENRWYKVTVDGQTGFVYAPLVVNLDPRLALPPSKGTVRNPAGPTVNTRTGPRADQALVRVLPNGTAVEVLDVVLGQAVEANEPRWYHIMLGDTPAYVYAPLLRVE